MMSPPISAKKLHQIENIMEFDLSQKMVAGLQHPNNFQDYQLRSKFSTGFSMSDYQKMTREQKLITLLLDNSKMGGTRTDAGGT
jgi:hypothetical protein